MKVLIVGAGAVGQTFGYLLQKAGAEVGLYDQPGRVAQLKLALQQTGLPIYQVTRPRKSPPIPHRLEHYQVVADEAEARTFGPDQIWFTTPSTFYHSEAFREFLQAVPSRRVVCFAPEGARGEFFPQGMDRDRLVFGGITFMAWQGDLQGGGGRAEGVNYCRSPLGIPLVGTEEACDEVKEWLERAGFRVTMGKPDDPMQATVTAVMTAFTAGLELAGWSLGAFRKSPWLKVAAGAARQAALSQMPGTGLIPRLSQGMLCSNLGFRLVSSILPSLFPFDIEKYLQFHYTKTREQTLTLLEMFAGDGENRGVEVGEVRRLLDGMRGM